MQSPPDLSAIGRRPARNGPSVGCVGLVAENLHNEWVTEIWGGVEEELAARQMSVLVGSVAKERLDGRATVEGWIRKRSVDGLIFVGPRAVESPLVEMAREARIDAALIGPNGAFPASIVVRTDNLGAGREIARHLHALAHRRIAFVSGPEEFLDSRERAEGLERGLFEYGLGLAPGHKLFRSRYHPDEGARYADFWLETRRSSAPTAVVFGNDCMALGFLRRIQASGLCVPQDVSVVGFDDGPSASLSCPSLTTGRQEMRRMGAMACQKLLESDGCDDTERTVVEFPMPLVVRESTGPARH